MSSQGGASPAPFPKDLPLSTHPLPEAFFPQGVGIATCMLPPVSISACQFFFCKCLPEYVTFVAK